jgi:hypothetical protein
MMKEKLTIGVPQSIAKIPDKKLHRIAKLREQFVNEIDPTKKVRLARKLNRACARVI